MTAYLKIAVSDRAKRGLKQQQGDVARATLHITG
jgi:hypothetical protein